MVKSGTGREGGAVSGSGSGSFPPWEGSMERGLPGRQAAGTREGSRMRENKGFVDRKGFV